MAKRWTDTRNLRVIDMRSSCNRVTTASTLDKAGIQVQLLSDSHIRVSGRIASAPVHIINGTITDYTSPWWVTDQQRLAAVIEMDLRRYVEC